MKIHGISLEQAESLLSPGICCTSQTTHIGLLLSTSPEYCPDKLPNTADTIGDPEQLTTDTQVKEALPAVADFTNKGTIQNLTLNKEFEKQKGRRLNGIFSASLETLKYHVTQPL